ncbi:DUF3221 domain-containing protein [Caldalkalibacillus mannanilyticus]|uniref:DUF3221 domain-containing protein n=1 Tax=Caldalkalibacillus mannanilyticus TaxID=1418 RepID=UPI000468AE7E|nr:DUF3221 domain-containing protein [Caldalkalibacillus mannanilyticus]
MKKKQKVTIIVILSVFLGGGLIINDLGDSRNHDQLRESSNDDHLRGSSSQDDVFKHEYNIIGLVAYKEEGRFLFVQDLDLEEIKGKSIEGIIEKSEQSIWFNANHTVLSQIKMGDKIEVWYSSMDQSLPAQGEAIRIKKMKNE